MGCCVWPALGTSTRDIKQGSGYRGLKLSREDGAADRLWGLLEYTYDFILEGVGFCKDNRRGRKGRVSKLYVKGGLKNVN